MKALIAAACIAVLAFVGYYFWGEYSKYEARQEAMRQTENLRKGLFTLAKAEDGNVLKVRHFCDLMTKINTNNPDRSLERESVIRTCRDFGYL